MNRFPGMRVAILALMAAGAVAAWPAMGAVTPNGLVVLHTDYGADSVYVGAIKGAMYAQWPGVRIDAITNSVPAFDVVAGAYLLLEACREFPAGTTFCCVVDPGVGTARKGIALETRSGHLFVGPDNGLLSLVADRLGVAMVRELSNRSLWRPGEVSHTFQGRDIFGPVAAALARGTPLEEAGPELKEFARLKIEPVRLEAGKLTGEVVRTDTYGNFVTNITEEDVARLGLAQGDSARVTIGKAAFTAPFKTTYGDVPEGKPVLVIQSSGFLECALNMGNLAQSLGTGAHAKVVLEKRK